MNPNETHRTTSPSANHSASAHSARRVIRKVLVLSVISMLGLIVLSFTAIRPSDLGPSNGKLAPLPDSPNCVSSTADKADFRMEPLNTVGIENPMANLKTAIESNFSRAKLIVDNGDYLHYEFTSLIFRFTDDVEFLLDDAGQKINFRSASRVGYSDLGANRNRMQRIRAAFER